MTHDYKADRERLEADFDRRHPELAHIQPPRVADELFECFRSSNAADHLDALMRLQNRVAAKAAGL